MKEEPVFRIGIQCMGHTLYVQGWAGVGLIIILIIQAMQLIQLHEPKMMPALSAHSY